MIDLRRSSPIRLHVHRRRADAGATSPSLPPARLPVRDLPAARRASTDTHGRHQLALVEPFGAVTAYDDDWFAGRPAVP